MQFCLENQFTKVLFEEKDSRVSIVKMAYFGVDYYNYPQGVDLSKLFIIGQTNGVNFARYARKGETLSFVSYNLDKDQNKQVLTVTEKSDRVEVITFFTLFNDSAVLSCRKEVKNISQDKLSLECVSVMNLKNVMSYEDGNGKASQKEVSNCNYEFQSVMNYAKESIASEGVPYLWKAHNTWCAEGVFERVDLNVEGLREHRRFKRSGKIAVSSNGSQTTYRYLPLGILEREPYGFFMFEMTASGSWSYEIEAGSGDRDDCEISLILTGKTLFDNGWSKTLSANEVYHTEECRLLGAKSVDGLAEQFTYFRRDVRKKFSVKPYEYVIYNNFQQNTYDNPTEEVDKFYLDEVLKYGVDYYVVDAGWHDETDHKISPTQKIGEWEENIGSYPSGFGKTVELAKSKGLKFGLWVELQSVGVFCKNKDLLPEDCYFHINGVRPVSNNRYHLNFDNPKTREFATGIIEKIAKRYKPDYIKIDYNQTAYGNDSATGTLTEGLEKHLRAYNEWFSNIQDAHPEILFESCASGGMSIDPTKSKITNVFSITDAGWYYGYPYILANISLATLPEQNGIWNMPMRKLFYPTNVYNKEWLTTDEEVIMNVVNSLYGVMHLSSKIEKLSPAQQSLLQEGIKYYKSLASVKEKAIPVFLNGFTLLDDNIVYVGLKTDEKLYLSVFNTSNTAVSVAKDLSKYDVDDVKLVYPCSAKNKYRLWRQVFECDIGALSARAFEFTIKKK